MTTASVALAIVAAFLFALSAALQQSAARQVQIEATGARKLIAGLLLIQQLVRDRWWLAGFVANVIGFGLHATALHLGSIPIVQAVLVVQLLFALPFAARRRRIRLLRRDWIGTLLVCGGLVVLVSQGASHSDIRNDLLPIAGCVVACGIVILVGVARFVVQQEQMRSALVAVAAGMCFCTTAVCVTMVTDALPSLHWSILVVAASTLLGGLLTQEAFHSGSLPTALTTMTITDPVLSYVAGATLFVVVVQPHPVAVATTAALVVTGIVMLANSPTLYDERDPDTRASDVARV